MAWTSFEQICRQIPRWYIQAFLSEPSNSSMEMNWMNPPVEDLPEIQNITATSGLDTQLTAQSTVDLISKRFETSYCNWNGQLYQQIDRLPMGSPLSPVLTEMYMIASEGTALKIAPFTPKHWFRNADDVLALLDDNQDPDALLQHLNSQHPRNQFTMEEETHQQLPFLDILLQQRHQSIATSVYRKPTHTDQYIHHQSNHHPQIKKGIVARLARRAKALQDLNEYPPHPVSNTITKTLKGTSKSAKPEPSPIRNIPYNGRISHCISRLIKKTTGIDVTFRSDTNLKTLLSANARGPTTPKCNNPAGCIYQIQCSCKEAYIGETGRPLAKRTRNISSKFGSEICCM
ncbi:uncharacterized protein [Haliotis asinina]|uniref:uncharacterized protein n=1 Tax=Haliotis asinina TaxID=109174 RepID=UPI003531E0DB